MPITTVRGSQILDGTITADDILNEAVTLAKMANIATLSVIGRNTAATGTPEILTAATDGHVLRRSSTTMGFGTIVTAGIAANAITYAKIQEVASGSLLGRESAGNGTVQEITLGTGLSFTGTTLNVAGLTDGSGTTAAGTAVDLGGVLTTPAALTTDTVNIITINGLPLDFDIVNGNVYVFGGVGNIGIGFTGVGFQAGYGNTGANFTGIGVDAGNGNTFDNVIALGITAAADAANQLVIAPAITHIRATGILTAAGYVLTALVAG